MCENIDRCDIYQKGIKAPARKLKLSEIPEKPWTHLTVDFITKLLLIAEKNTILVVCNRLSKMMYFVAIIERILAEELARWFRDNIWKLYRLLESVMSDREPQFAVKLAKELNRSLGIEIRLSTSFHSQSDRQTE